jgi:acetylglutamate kinase
MEWFFGPLKKGIAQKMAKERYFNGSASSKRGYELVIDFFSNIGASREASMYLKMFRDIVPWRFAVVLISNESMERSSRTVALDLAYLSGLGLYPVIVLDNLQNLGGKLVRPVASHSPKTLKTGRRIRKLTTINSSLVASVAQAGGRAISIYNEIFSLRTPLPGDPDFDFRLLVDYINLVPIRSAVRNHQIPIVSPVIMDTEGRMTVISSEKVSKALCMRLNPQKFIVISDRGGLLNRDGHIIHNIILSLDYNSLVSSESLDTEGREQLEAAVRILREVPDLTLQIASAENLLYELFTVKGRGTYLRAGHTIMMSDSYEGLDLGRMREILENGFGKSLVDDYFLEKPHRVIYDKDYHGLIIVKHLTADIFYLDKFVVGTQWQGEGMGGPLWRELTKHYKKIIWRANPANPINRWYMEQVDGFQRSGKWNIYWIGLSPAEVGALIDRVKEIRRTVV